MAQRNPVLLPEIRQNKPACPKCGNEQFSGRSLGGTVRFTCTKCANVWSGGLPILPPDPSNPLVPDASPPTIRFVEVRDKSGNVLAVEELKSAPNRTPDFKKGAPITDEGEI